MPTKTKKEIIKALKAANFNYENEIITLVGEEEESPPSMSSASRTMTPDDLKRQILFYERILNFVNKIPIIGRKELLTKIDEIMVYIASSNEILTIAASLLEGTTIIDLIKRLIALFQVGKLTKGASAADCCKALGLAA